MSLVQRPDELPLVVLSEPGDERARGHHFEAHDLQRVEDQPGGKAELCPLGLVVVDLRLVLNLLGQDTNLVVAQALNCAPVLDGVLPDEDVRHLAAAAASLFTLLKHL